MALKTHGGHSCLHFYLKKTDIPTTSCSALLGMDETWKHGYDLAV